MISRDTIIEAMHAALAPLPYFHALWLEGADANDAVDEYSDIDFNVDIDDDMEQAAYVVVEDALAAIAPVDFRYVTDHEHPKLRQRIYHLQGTGPYLMIDFNWQLHSRDPKECCFIEGSRIEAAKVLFDKSGVITQAPFDPAKYVDQHKSLIDMAKFRVSQADRARKYVRRGQFPEAYAYYNRYLIEPLVDLLRIIHTPAFSDYYLIHISSHIPAAEQARLTALLQNASLAELEANIDRAAVWIGELLAILPQN